MDGIELTGRVSNSNDPASSSLEWPDYVVIGKLSF